MASKQLSENASPAHLGRADFEPMTLVSCSFMRTAAASTATTNGSINPFTPTASNSAASTSEPLAVLDDVATASRSSMALATPSRNTAGGARVFSPAVVRDVLCVMYSTGMYDYSGRWSSQIGLPAKSGVSGLVMVVVPNLCGLCIFSPRLDAAGNSVRGAPGF